jgi:exopolysaccharide biosynthesis polyprenyl glycosylphosphotransferase
MALTAGPVATNGRGPRNQVVGRARRDDGSPSGLLINDSIGQSPTACPRGVDRPKHRSWGRRYSARLMVTDFLALLLASAVVQFIRVPATNAETLLDNHLLYAAVTMALLVIWLLALTWYGTRDWRTVGFGPAEYRRIIQATFTVFGVVAIASYLYKLELPRSYLLVMMPLGLGALLGARYVWRRWLHRQRDTGEYLSLVLAVGDVVTVTELLNDLRRAPRAGYRVIGVCVSGGMGSAEDPLLKIAEVPVLGGLDKVAEIVRTSGADTVAVTATAAFGPSAVRRLSWELENTDAELILAPALTNIAGPRIHTQPVAGLPLIHVARPTYRGANRILKKSFDIVGGLSLLVIFSPVLVGVAVAIKLTSAGPVLFLQDRVGINGRVFRMIKFRSMEVDAEERLAMLREEGRDAGNDVLFKMRNDPRVTRIGRLIRRYSIDELPQLFNVISGDMSLVGPRPPLKAEVDLYGDEVRRRLLVKPGMTGLWQVSGRSDLSWDDAARLDVYYVENWSITGDVVIMWKTARVVVSCAGAY